MSIRFKTGQPVVVAQDIPCVPGSGVPMIPAGTPAVSVLKVTDADTEMLAYLGRKISIQKFPPVHFAARPKAPQSEVEDWIIRYLRTATAADASNAPFHDEFFLQFGGRRPQRYWGAEPVDEAQRMLSQMAQRGILRRSKISLGFAWQPGLPKWVWSYSLTDLYREFSGA